MFVVFFFKDENTIEDKLKETRQNQMYKNF